MEFAAVSSSKLSAKTVAITLSNEEAQNPANAFSALLNLSGNMKFKSEKGLSQAQAQAENQWMRTQSQREPDAAPKPKADNDTKPKDKSAAAADKSSKDDNDDVAAAGKADTTEDTSTTEKTGVAATTETQPTEQTAAVGLEAVQAVSIQFQILVELPNGNLQDMGTFDLKSLMAAAAQDSSLASALEAAFTQAANSLSAGQALSSALTQTQTADPSLAATLAQAGPAVTDTADTGAVADLFKQIAAAFHPLAQQGATTAAHAQVAQTAQTATTAANTDTTKTDLDLQSPEAARQSAALSKIFGDADKIRIQVAVDGRKVADLPFDSSPFNRFVGYNPEAMRTVSTANGQAGQGQATNALMAAGDNAQPQVGVATPNTNLQSNLSGQQNAANGNLPRPEVALPRAPDAPAPANSNSNSSSSSQSQSPSFASAMSQTTGSTAPTQTTAPERPAPTPPQQIIEQIKVNITRAAKAGLDRVTIQLRPEELGRIEIKLEMTQDGQVRADVTADNPATLELLQREARGLERALQDAGLNADAGNLEFKLRNEAEDRLAENGEQRGKTGANHGDGKNPLDGEADAEDTFDYGLAARQRGGIDTYV